MTARANRIKRRAHVVARDLLGVGYRLQRRFGQARHHRGEQVVLAAEVAVDRPLGTADLFDHRVDAGVGITITQEELAGRGKYLIPQIIRASAKSDGGTHRRRL